MELDEKANNIRHTQQGKKGDNASQTSPVKFENMRDVVKTNKINVIPLGDKRYWAYARLPKTEMVVREYFSGNHWILGALGNCKKLQFLNLLQWRQVNGLEIDESFHFGFSYRRFDLAQVRSLSRI